MTTKEKAKELAENYLQKTIEFAYVETSYKELAKQCALIAVDEILNILPFDELRYWEEVKQEINKL